MSFEIEFSPRERKREKVSNLVVHHPGNGFQLLFLEAGDPRHPYPERENRGCFAFRGQVNYGRQGAVPLGAERKHDLSLRVAKERE